MKLNLFHFFELLAILLAATTVSVAQTTQPFPASLGRIGTFDVRSIVVAYYGSSIFDQHLKQMMAQHDQALRNGDKATASRLEAQGQNEQSMAEKQLAGLAPIDNILSAIQPSLPSIASRENVLAIVDHPAYVQPDLVLVDVTDAIVDALNPNSHARRSIEDLRKRPPAQEGSAR